MATVINLPRDTRFGDLGEALGGIAGSFFQDRRQQAEDEEEERRRQILIENLSENDPEKRERLEALSRLGTGAEELVRIAKEFSVDKDLETAQRDFDTFIEGSDFSDEVKKRLRLAKRAKAADIPVPAFPSKPSGSRASITVSKLDESGARVSRKILVEPGETSDQANERLGTEAQGFVVGEIADVEEQQRNTIVGRIADVGFDNLSQAEQDLAVSLLSKPGESAITAAIRFGSRNKAASAPTQDVITGPGDLDKPIANLTVEDIQTMDPKVFDSLSKEEQAALAFRARELGLIE